MKTHSHHHAPPDDRARRPGGRAALTGVLAALALLTAACGCSKGPSAPAQPEAAPSPSAKATDDLALRSLGEGGPSAGGEGPAVAETTGETGAAPADSPEYDIVDPMPEDPVLDMLLEAMEGGDPQMRSVAVETASSMPGEEVTRWCIGHMRKASPAARAAILDVLARRDDPAGLGTALEALRDPDEPVRLAAVHATAALGKEMVVGPLVDLLEGPNVRERSAAREALLEMPGEEATRAIAKSLRNAGGPAETRCALLEILGRRHAAAHLDVILAAAGDEDGSVRVAALKVLGGLAEADSLESLLGFLVKASVRPGKESRERRVAEKAVRAVCARAEDKEACAKVVLAALRQPQRSQRTQRGNERQGTQPSETSISSVADVALRASLLRQLGRLGAASGLPVVRAALEGASPEVRDSAVRALADWPDATVASDLLAIATSAPEKTHRVLALRGYVRVVGLFRPRGSERTAEDTVRMYERAMILADRPDQKRMVLAGLAKVKHVGAFRTTVPFLGDEALKDEAAIAVVKIARSVSGENPDEARAALEKVLAASPEESVREQAKEALELIGIEQVGKREE